MSKRINIGSDHQIVYASYKDDDKVGINVIHKGKDGQECQGWCPFNGRAWCDSFTLGQVAGWDIQSLEPLTLSPSILCRTCGDHGFIREGKWVPA